MTMQTVSLSSWRLALQVRLWRYGWIWLLTALVSLLVIAISSLWLPQLKASSNNVQLEIEQLQKQGFAQRNASEVIPTPTSDELALQALDRITYSEAQISAVLRAIYGLAKQQGIAVAQSEFQTSSDGRAGLRQLQVSLPMRASYPQFKAFAQEVLRQYPGVSLDQLHIKREAITQTQPELRIKLSLWIDPRKSGSNIAIKQGRS
jgi:hypothetical protein